MKNLQIGQVINCQYPSSTSGKLEARNGCEIQEMRGDQILVVWPSAPTKSKYRSFKVKSLIIN